MAVRLKAAAPPAPPGGARPALSPLSPAHTNVSPHDPNKARKGKKRKARGAPDEILECPVCYECMMPPIYQCPHGHLVCSTCKCQLSRCPTCRSALGEIRALAVEQLAASFDFPCKFREFGCSQSIPYADKKDHEDECLYKPILCPMSEQDEECKWQGNPSALVAHLAKAHPVLDQTVGRHLDMTITNPELEPPVLHWDSLYLHESQPFLLRAQQNATEEFIVYVVHLTGPPRLYKIEVEGFGRSYSFTSTTRSVTDSKKVRNEQDCLYLTPVIATVLSGGGRYLDLRIRGELKFGAEARP